jgi:hypothetical protein
MGETLGKNHHLVVITNRTDDSTLDAVAHWQRHGIDIQAWRFRIYNGTPAAFYLDLPELFIHGKTCEPKGAKRRLHTNAQCANHRRAAR